MPIIDHYSGLNHKAGMDDSGGDESGFLIPSWVKRDQDIRRLKAYQILGGYMETVAREFVIPPEGADLEEFQDAYREYGDAPMMVERIAAGVLGDDAMVTVVGVDEPLSDRAPIGLPPTPPSEELEDVAAKIAAVAYEAEQRVYEQATTAKLEEWERRSNELPLLQERQRWLQDWADKESLFAMLLEAESETTIPLGDSVIQVGWNLGKKRPKLSLHDPGTYFPDLDETEDNDFPAVVHICWQYVETVDDEETEFVRRKTWEMFPLEPGEDDEDPGADLGGTPLYFETGDEQTHSCLFTDATFLADDFDDVYAELPTKGAVYNLVDVGDGEPIDAFRVALGMDEIPLVHYPNSLAKSGQHFGRGHLTRLAQLLDEMAGLDSDIGLASEWAARPPVAVAGMNPGDTTLDLNPGQVLKMVEGGDLTVVDMAQNLSVLLEREKVALRRWSVNGGVPETLLGRADTAAVLSGISRALSFTPFVQLINRMRLARNAKNDLLLKMVQRVAIHNGDETIGDGVWPAEIRYGSFMPQDLPGLMEFLEPAIRSNLVSQQTAISMLAEAGVPSGDPDAELSAIRLIMGDTAGQVADATGSSALGAQLLGVTIPETDDDIDPATGQPIVDPTTVTAAPAAPAV